MKKYVLFAAMLVAFSATAQQKKDKDYSTDISVIVDQSDYYGLTKDQRQKLIARKKSIGREFAAIGRDRSLSGYEKGERKRQLSASIQKDIRNILNDGQYTKWEKHNVYDRERDSKKDTIERQLDVLEDNYERDIKQIENTHYKNKDYMKQEKDKRKSIYKAEKEKLKRLKENL